MKVSRWKEPLLHCYLSTSRACEDTVDNWPEAIMAQAGISTQLFTAHLTKRGSHLKGQVIGGVYTGHTEGLVIRFYIHLVLALPVWPRFYSSSIGHASLAPVVA
jgi:hypothetical protein